MKMFKSGYDVVHQREWKSIPEALREETVFFSHIEDEGGKARRVGPNQLTMRHNSASFKRIIGCILRQKIHRILKQRRSWWGKQTVQFPLDKTIVLECLEKIVLLQTSVALDNEGVFIH